MNSPHFHSSQILTLELGGHLRPSVYCRVSKWMKKYGLEAAEEIAQFEFDHLKAVADLVEKEKIDCDFKLSRSFDIHTETEEAAAAKDDYLKLKAAGIAKETIDDVVFYEGEEAEKVRRMSNFDLTKLIIS